MNRPPPQHQPSTLIKVIQISILIIYSLSNIVASFSSASIVAESAQDLQEVINNWQTPAIQDIQVVNTGLCPLGYQEAFNIVWPGTNPGCDCSDVNYIYKVTYKISCEQCTGACSIDQQKAGCIDIPGYEPFTLNQWGSSNGKPTKICIRRSSETWLDVASKSDTTCKDPNARPCGKSKENIFCTKQAQCPINDLKIISASSLGALKSCTYENGCMVLSSDGTDLKMLQFSRGKDNDALPVSQFNVNEYGMCRNSEHENITPNRKEFWLLKKKRTTCEIQGNNLWNLADSYSEFRLYKINGLEPRISSLIDFGYYEPGKSGDDYSWNLYTRNYFPWAIKCRDRMGKLTGNMYSFQGLKIAQYAQFIVNSLIGVLLGVIIPILICFNAKEKFRKTFNWSAKSLQLPLQIVVAGFAFLVKEFYTGIVNDSCSSFPVMELMSNAYVDSKVAYIMNLRGIGVVCFALLADLAIWIHTKFSQRRQDEYHPQVNIEQQQRPPFDQENARQ